MCHLGDVVKGVFWQYNDRKCKNLRPCPAHKDGGGANLHLFDQINPDVLVVRPLLELFLHFREEKCLQLLNSCNLEVHPRLLVA